MLTNGERTEAEGAVQRRRRRLAPALARPGALAVAAYLVLAVLLFAGAWRSPETRHIGTPGDPPVNVWFLSWTPYALSHGHAPFLTDHINYPWGVNLMWNALMPLPGVVLWPLTAAFRPLVAYNAMATLNLALSASCAYLMCRRFVTSRLAAFAGGLVYGFSPYMMAQSHDHPSLTAAFIPPLLFLVLHELLVRQQKSPLRAGILLGLLVAAQLFITEELLASEALAAVLGVVLLCALAPRSVQPRLRHALIAATVGAVVFAALAVGPLQVQFFGPHRLHGEVQPRSVFVTDAANFVVPTEVQLVAPRGAVDWSHRWSGNLSEYDAYLGVPLLLVALIATVGQWRQGVVRVSGLLALCMAVLSLGPKLHVNGRLTNLSLPWGWVQHVPLVNNMLPNRLMLYVDLLAALLLAVFVDRAWAAPRPAWRVLGIGALVAVLVSLFPGLPYPSTKPVVPPFFTDGSMRRVPEGTVMLIAPFQQLYPDEPMLWQAEARMRFRMPQGYFIGPDAHGKPFYGALFSAMSVTMEQIQGGQTPALTPDLREQIVRELAVRRVRTVLVGPIEHQSEMLQLFGYVFDRAPVEVHGVYLWEHVGQPTS